MKTNRTDPTTLTNQTGSNRKSRKVSLLIGAAIVAAFALAACAPSQPSPATSSEQPSSAATSSPQSDASSQLVSDFQITVYQGEDVLGGQEVAFSDVLSQGKPVILNFWAGLCPPCRLEMPDLQEVYGEYNDQVLLVGVDVGTFVGLGSEEDGRALLKEVGATYPAGTTSDAEVMRAYEVIGMPTTVFMTPNGEIVQKWTGLLTKDKMEELLEELLEASASS
jgi:thiol-disulfide isomerase/thioredoxin